MKKLIALLLAALMVLSMAACNTQKPAETKATGPAETNAPGETTEAPTEAEPVDPMAPYEETVRVGIGRMDIAGLKFCNDKDTMDDNEYLRYIKEKLNIDVEYEWLAATEDIYNTKVAMALTSNQIPDIMVVNEQVMLKMAEAGVLEDLTEVYDTYASDFLKSFYDSDPSHAALNVAMHDGKMVALPAQNCMGGNYNMFWYREDWRKQLDLPEPKTIQDGIDMMYAFADADFDGKDTIGLLGDPKFSAINSWDSFNILMASKNAYQGMWLRNDAGELYYTSVAPEMRDALQMLAKMYADGVIDKEFAVGDFEGKSAARMNGLVGCWFCPYWYGWNAGPILVDNPEAELRCALLTDENGVFHSGINKPSPAFAVVRKGYEHPEALMKIFNVQQAAIRGADPNFGEDWLRDKYGLDSTEVYSSGNQATWPVNMNVDYFNAIEQRCASVLAAYYAEGDEKKALEEAMDPAAASWYAAFIDYTSTGDSTETRDKNLWGTPGCVLAGNLLNTTKIENTISLFNGTTDTMTQIWPTLTKMEDEVFLKIIMGEEPIEKFDEFVEKWHQLGGDQVLAEIDAMLGK